MRWSLLAGGIVGFALLGIPYAFVGVGGTPDAAGKAGSSADAVASSASGLARTDGARRSSRADAPAAVPHEAAPADRVARTITEPKGSSAASAVAADAPAKPPSRESGFGVIPEAPPSPFENESAPPPSAWSARPADLALTITPLAPEEVGALVDDGRGGSVAPTQPAQIDLRADRAWSAGAQDPVLAIGALTLTTYRYPSPNVIRFVIADVSAIGRDDDVSIRYGAGPVLVLRKGAQP
jgi:hypothetical protein